MIEGLVNNRLNEEELTQLLQAISTLKRYKEFQTFIDFLNGMVNSIDQLNRAALAPELQWQQGAAQLLEGLLDLIKDSSITGRELYERLQAGEKLRNTTGFFPE